MLYKRVNFVYRSAIAGVIGFLLLLSVSGFIEQDAPDSNWGDKVLPSPQKVEWNQNVTFSPGAVKTIYLYAKADRQDRFAASLLQDKIKELYDNAPQVKTLSSYSNLAEPAIVLGIPSRDSDFSDYSKKLPAPRSNNDQSYVLNIDKNKVIISGGGGAGLFYGVQTLNQLVEDSKWSDKSIPGGLVQDWPEIKLRVVHFDEKHHLDRYEYLKDAIAKLAKYKVNGVLFEFENKLNYASHPDIAAPNSFSPEQVKALTQYAHKYHVDIIPLVQGLGHAGYILKHNKYKNLREDPESNWAFNPLKKGTYDLLFDMYQEAIDATPGVKYFHVGGDEVRFTGRNPQLQKYKKEHGNLALYLMWLNKVHKFLQDHNRTMIFWDDVPLKRAGIYKYTYREAPDQHFDSLWTSGIHKLDNIIDKFPQDGVFNRWNYGMAREKGNIRIMDWYNKNHFDQISATAIQNSRPLIPSYDLKPANIKSFVTLSADKKVLGEVCTAWDDSGVHFATYWMGFLASSEYAWSSKSPASLHQYWDKFIHRFFGPGTSGLVDAFHNLSKRVDFWDTALMAKGRKHLVHRNGSQLIKLPDVQKTPEEGSWSEHFKSLVATAKQEEAKCDAAIKTMQQNEQNVYRNAYNLKVFASMGEFMKAHADLVQSIGKIARYCDNAQSAYKQDEKEKVIDNLDKMASTADAAWDKYKSSYEDLKKVWEISRYPKGGEGFIPNRYHHFASQREDLSYLIMGEEKLDLNRYADNIREIAEQYQSQGTLSH